MVKRPKILSAAFVKTVKEPGRYGDGRGGHGLSLLVKPTSTGRRSKTWSQRLRIGGKPCNVGLGAYPVVTLAEAREAALENRRAVARGRDPRRGGMPTFSEAAMKVIELRSPSWKDGGKTEKHWKSSLRTYAFPVLGDRPVADVTRADVMKVVEPIWNDRRDTANRVLQRIGAVMKWSIASGFRVDNPASDAIRSVLPNGKGERRHHKALPYAQVSAAIAQVQESRNLLAAKLCFEFLVLTASRSGEARGACWTEINLESREWIVPGGRMKESRDHRVPLSARAMDVLREAKLLDDGSGLIFPSTRHGRPLHHGALTRLLQRLGIDATPHGFRSSFRDWCSEATDTPHAVAEAALAHVNPNKAEAAYARSDLFERRRQLMDDWATYLNPAAEQRGEREHHYG